MMRSSKSYPVIANDLHSLGLSVGSENTAPSLNNLRRESRQVLGIQMSRWGRDVLHPEGNLLIRFGLQRFREPGQFGSSRYRCHWAGRTVELHSTCVGIYGDESPGIVFLRAHRCAYLTGLSLLGTLKVKNPSKRGVLRSKVCTTLGLSTGRLVGS